MIKVQITMLFGPQLARGAVLEAKLGVHKLNRSASQLELRDVT